MPMTASCRCVIQLGIFILVAPAVGCSSGGATADGPSGPGGNDAGAAADQAIDVVAAPDGGQADVAAIDSAFSAPDGAGVDVADAAADAGPGLLALKDYQGTWAASDGTVVGSDGTTLKATSVKLKVGRVSGYWDVDASAETAVLSTFARFHFSTELHESATGMLTARCYDTSFVMRPVGQVNATGLTISENMDANCTHRDGTLSVRPLPDGRIAIEFLTSSGDGTATGGKATLARMSGP